jgi:hypothetical protein
VLDRVISSYAPSVKAIIHGRQHPVRRSAGPFSDYALLVSREIPDLSGNGILPFAADEVKMLKNLCRELQLWSLTPILRKDNVLKHLQACRIFHFTGHGQSDPAEPSRSCLLLEDWKTSPLTVGDLRDYRLQENGPFLGYLSACSTGANEAARLADEGIHLVSAFQLAGHELRDDTLTSMANQASMLQSITRPSMPAPAMGYRKDQIIAQRRRASPELASRAQQCRVSPAQLQSIGNDAGGRGEMCGDQDLSGARRFRQRIQERKRVHGRSLRRTRTIDRFVWNS